MNSIYVKPFTFRSAVLAGSTLIVTYIVLFLSNRRGIPGSRLWHLDPFSKPYDPDGFRVPCFGPRGKLLTESVDDQLQCRSLDHPYPRPLGGSYEALGLDQTWMTADGRYGPYGYGEEGTVNYSRSRVEWDSVNWASLQDACLARNSFRFQKTSNIVKLKTLPMPGKLQRLKSAINSNKGPRKSTGRTAIVVRTWSGYDYKKNDMLNLRSLVVETALLSGGEYAVFLLVHIKDTSSDIFKNTTAYRAALETTVPLEFRSMAVLFDESLLNAWYPKVEEHSAYLQITQPVQLFAQTFDNFDHYWQWEMDSRLTGNTLNYLEAVSRFAKASPRKQALERGSFRYIPEIHGKYEELLAMVNSSVEGTGIWGPLRIPEIKKPIGPSPPSTDPTHDPFRWGVGEEADFIPTVPCKSLPLTTSWLFNDTISGFSAGVMAPRLFCPQAVSRMSWKLLNAVHTALIEQGLYIPSEATMPSFVLWHGLKYSQPPQPWFIQAREDIPQDAASIDEIVNGSPPQATYGGFAFGSNSYDEQVLDHYNWHTEQSWHWRSQLPSDIMNKWLGDDRAPMDGTKLADILYEQDGHIYAPNIWLHPYKTNT